ncbi:hypothetical protein [Saccharothrix deserti]|uniref:hypothetical protein n=1 Tax=Saccharothrix deserti TaxID=2593674 RepID=UPI00131E1E87|nr:hypothetical protein [Saccharothrix deserti]
MRSEPDLARPNDLALRKSFDKVVDTYAKRYPSRTRDEWERAFLILHEKINTGIIAGGLPAIVKQLEDGEYDLVAFSIGDLFDLLKDAR